MKINTVSWRPFPESVIEYNNTLYYATAKGINIVEMNSKEFRIIYSGCDENVWGAFHFSLMYRDEIVFVPHKADYLYVYNPTQRQGKIVNLPDREENECLVPYVSDAGLMLYGLKTSRLHRVTQDWNIEIVSKGEMAQWKTYGSTESSSFIGLWDEQRNTIGCIDKTTNCLKQFTISGETVCSVTADNRFIYALTVEGSLLLFDAVNGNQVKAIPVQVPNGNNKLIVLENQCYIMPIQGMRIEIVSLFGNYTVSERYINMSLEKKHIAWTVGTDKKLWGIAEDIECSWKNGLVLFKYDLLNDQIEVYPWETIVMKQEMINCKGKDIFLVENSHYGLNEMIEWLKND